MREIMRTIATRPVDELYRRDPQLLTLQRAIGPSSAESQFVDLVWRQAQAGITRRAQFRGAFRFMVADQAWVDNFGDLVVASNEEKASPSRGHSPLRLEELLEWIELRVERGLAVLLELGAHGDIALCYRLSAATGQNLFYGPSSAEPAPPLTELRRWLRVDLEEGDMDELLAGVQREIRRALGVPPARD